VAPVDGRLRVVSRFDPPEVRWGSGHRGVDLATAVGAPVRAAAPGVVAFAARLAGRGVVVVRHGELRTTYEPVASSVAVGARVDAGDTIGVLEATGSHCWAEPCLHWGLLRGTRYLDPLALLGLAPVRLLPLTTGARPAQSWAPWPTTTRARPAARSPATRAPSGIPRQPGAATLAAAGVGAAAAGLGAVWAVRRRAGP
jgi:murein DD-endopeptidase MepM/ murein hydrolase activator NlpD